MNTRAERRKTPREPRFSLVQYRLGSARQVIAAGDACAYDVSLGGVLLHILGPLPAVPSGLDSQDIHIDCHFLGVDGDDTWIRGRIARVVRPIAQTEESHSTVYIGVAFESDDLAATYIERFLNRVPVYTSREEMASLLEISHLLTSSVDLDHLLHLILATVCRLMQSEASSVLLIDQVTGELCFRASSGTGSERLKMVRLKQGEGIAGWVVKERRPLAVNDVQKDPRFYNKVDAVTGLKSKSMLAVPLRDGDQIIGVIEVLNTSKEREFEQEDVELLTAFAAHAAIAIRNAQLVSNIKQENRYLQGELEERYRTLIGESRVMRDTIEMARTAAETPVTVLLLGESGVGKEILARSIHRWSPRVRKPFLAVNCVALSEHLLESELFGHEKGAFTGAHQQKKGIFELAHGGTVFLDEIGDMKPELQAKLLRVLQDHKFERVGGSEPICVDIRVVAATNQDLQAAVRAGRFRKDLFFRLNVVAITLPALRDRKEDIPALGSFFVERYCRELKRPAMTILPETVQSLCQYDWPGNVRELENVIERAIVLTSGRELRPVDVRVNVSDVSPSSDGCLFDLSFHASIQAHKQALIRHALEKAGGNKTQAAHLLKLQPNYLMRLCKQLDL
jgi:Nif-specific regulatory protein